MNSKLRLALLAGCVVTISSWPAYAGFQWTAPTAATATTGTLGNEVYVPRAMAAPVAPVMSETLPQSVNQIAAGSPVRTMPDGPVTAAPVYGNGMTDDPVTWNQSMNAQNARSPQNIMPAETAPLYNPPVAAAAPVAPVMQAPIISQAPVGNGMYQIADGFGADLPLVMALRQIVPAQYGFSFDAGVNVSEHVSWQGGRPWDVVLAETVAPLGLTATIRGNVVSIARGGYAPAATPQPIILSGPQVVTETVQTASTMPMPVAPVVMQTSAVAAPMAATPAVMQQTTQTPIIGGGIIPAAAGGDSAELGTTGTWTAPRNSSLRGILEDWSKRVNVELYWASEYDYPVQSAVSINGTFEEAVQVLLKGLKDSKPRPMGRLHPNLPNGPAVLVIETRQNSM